MICFLNKHSRIQDKLISTIHKGIILDNYLVRYHIESKTQKTLPSSLVPAPYYSGTWNVKILIFFQSIIYMVHEWLHNTWPHVAIFTAFFFTFSYFGQELETLYFIIWHVRRAHYTNPNNVCFGQWHRVQRRHIRNYCSEILFWID